MDARTLCSVCGKRHAIKTDGRGPVCRPCSFGGEVMLPARSYKVGRNDLCPCDSGKKFKRCCGDIHGTPNAAAP